MLALFIISSVLQIMLAPTPRVEHAKPASDFSAPVAEEGRPIPVVFGEVLIEAPNVVWYGDSEAQPIYSGGGGKK
ncbi:MAG TPA: hypothetical protein EYP40_07040 [Chromatiales bacterium]|nr:hypothetical protein [Chromatiales bacterium]